MRIIRNVTSSQKQEQVTKYGDETHVLLDEREVEVVNEDETSYVQYEYDKVIVVNSSTYADAVEAATNYFRKVNKEHLLNSIVVTTSSGKEFYADPISRTDLADAISIANESGETTVLWKLATGWEEVTLEEMKEARLLGLQEKAKVIGRIMGIDM